MTDSRQLNPQDTLVIASHNMGKVREITVLLEPLGIPSRVGVALDAPGDAVVGALPLGHFQLV